MARKFNPEDIERLKRNISIEAVCRERGIDLKKHGRNNLIARCPLPGHTDEKPSFIVTPSKNVFHCMGCGKGGSVIDLIMLLDGLTFKEAVEKLLPSNGLLKRASDLPAAPRGDAAQAGIKQPETESPSIPEEKAQPLLDRIVTVYEKTFADEDQGRAYLEGRGLTDAGLFTQHRVGFCNGKLTSILPNTGSTREDLKALSIILKNGQERFAGCVVCPVFDLEGNITTLYGRYTGPGPKKHVYLSGRHTGLWNVAVIKTYSEIILVESILDAMSLITAGCSNVISIQGTNGLTDSDLALFKQYGLQKLVLMLDNDQAGVAAEKRLKEKIRSKLDCAVEVKTLPPGLDPNGYLQKYGAQKLREFMNSDNPSFTNKAAQDSEPVAETAVIRADGGHAQASGLVVTYGLRTYQALGIDKGLRKLRATVRVEHAGKLHVDTLDFYSARSRRILIQDLCRIFEETPETIEADVTRLMREIEKAPTPEKENPSKPNPVHTMTGKDRTEAERFGQSPDLVRQILHDFETCGLVGEEPNKLLGYVAMTSRKREKPLAVLILSSSGAGKTALQDTTCMFCPPEDLVKVTSLSGKALFYKEQMSLKYKVLAVEEDDGAEEANYALRNLISSGVLISESTIKDLATGRLTTQENRVEGPTTVFLTTTNPQIDPETKSRFFVTSIDESREQTRRILLFQRQKHMSGELTGSAEIEAVLRRHRNFQRLLKPLVVKDPYGDRLTYGDDRLQGRRDQPKYLALIEAIAFLRQMQKPIKWQQRNGKPSPYIEVDREDIRIANKLADEVLGRSLDELSRPGRDLLDLLEQMTRDRVEQEKKRNPDYKHRTTSIIFSRREVREVTGWSNTRLHIHLKELVEFEYLVIETGRNGMPYRYRLAYEGQGKDGEKFFLGLIDIDKLDDSTPSTDDAPDKEPLK